jgi:8-oxo-dGTP pyrophosphatase MutT (NUDIX family)
VDALPGADGPPAEWDDGSAAHRFRVVPAAYVFLRRDQEVLLQLRSGTGFMDDHWAASAAGHVEPGESVVQAAVREVREELGLELAPADLRPVTTLHRGQPAGPALEQRVDFFFEAVRWSGTPGVREADKAAELGWFPLTALPLPVVPHELVVLRALRDGRVPPIMTFGFADAEAGPRPHTGWRPGSA